jgi:hypothetical protein
MTGDHHGQMARVATLLARALDGLLGTHTSSAAVAHDIGLTQKSSPTSMDEIFGRSRARVSGNPGYGAEPTSEGQWRLTQRPAARQRRGRRDLYVNLSTIHGQPSSCTES